jgi:hypothetical protein
LDAKVRSALIFFFYHQDCMRGGREMPLVHA